MKKIIYSIFLILTMFLFTACESENIVEEPIKNKEKNEEKEESKEIDYISQFQSKLIELGYEKTDYKFNDEFVKNYGDNIYMFTFFKTPSNKPASAGFNLCKKNNIYNCSIYSYVTNYGGIGDCTYDLKENKNVKGYSCTTQQISIAKNTKNIFENEFIKTGLNIDDILSQYIKE